MDFNSRQKILKEVDTLEKELTDIQFVIIHKDSIGYKKLLNKLTVLQVNSFDTQMQGAIKEAITYLNSVNELTFGQSNIDEIQNIFKSYSDNLSTFIEPDVFKLNEQLYKFGINEIGKSTGMKLSFNVADAEAASVLGTHNMFWVNDYYTSQLQNDIDNILRPYFTAGRTIEEVAQAFQLKFTKATDKGINYFEGLAEHTVNRVRELGKVTGFEKAGIVKYEIRAIMDDRTSEICLSMNGKTFKVTRAMDFRDSILGLSDPADIKTIAPWRSADEISGISDTDLPVGMELPPYHWRCRTTTVAYFV